MMKSTREPMKIEEEIRISDLETLKVISDPLRVQMLERIGLASDTGRLTTVKQLSEDLDIPQTKLYYHIKLLEKHNLIQVAETRVVSGIIEKHYQVRARRIRAELDISKHTNLDRDEGMALTLASIATMFDTAYKNVERSFRHRLQETDSGDDEKIAMLSSQAVLQLSPEQAKSFIDKLNELVSEYEDIDYPDGLPFGLTIVFNPNYHLKTKKTKFETATLSQLPTIDMKEPHIPPQL
jgi:DNA-binding transcriptional ArsR family regulator